MTIEHPPVLRVSDVDRNGTLRLHNAVALGLIDIGEFRNALRRSRRRGCAELDILVDDLPGPGAIVTSATDRPNCAAGWGSLKRHGEIVPTRLDPGAADGFGRTRSSRPLRGSGRRDRTGHHPRIADLRLPDGASASIDDVTVYAGSARERRKRAARPRETRTLC